MFCLNKEFNVARKSLNNILTLGYSTLEVEYELTSIKTSFGFPLTWQVMHL